MKMNVLAARLCPTFATPWTVSPSGSSVQGDSPGKKTGVRSYSLLQGVFPTQGSNPGHLRGRLIVYPLSQQGSSLPTGANPLLMHVHVITLVPCSQDCVLVQSLWKSVGRHLAKLKVTQKLPSWVAALENPLPVCPHVSLLSESRL